MYFEFGLGIGFALGFIVGMYITKVVWPEYEESIWDRKKRENEIAQGAIEKYKRRSHGDAEQKQ